MGTMMTNSKFFARLCLAAVFLLTAANAGRVKCVNFVDYRHKRFHQRRGEIKKSQISLKEAVNQLKGLKSQEGHFSFYKGSKLGMRLYPKAGDDLAWLVFNCDTVADRAKLLGMILEESKIPGSITSLPDGWEETFDGEPFYVNKSGEPWTSPDGTKVPHGEGTHTRPEDHKIIQLDEEERKKILDQQVKDQNHEGRRRLSSAQRLLERLFA